ncbi:hypothetical protein YIM1640_03870 [Thermus oshimai]
MRGYGFLVALPLLLLWGVALWLYPRLPEPLPVHWNLWGEPDRFGSCLEALFLFPLAMTALLPPLALLPRLDPKGKGLEGLMVGLAWFFFFLYLAFVGVYAGWWAEPPLFRVAGLFFLFLALYLPRIPQNPFAGVRTPWTLGDPRVWRRVHRAAAWGLGALGGVALFLPPRGLGLLAFLGLLLLVSLSLVLYSYALGKRKAGQD